MKINEIKIITVDEMIEALEIIKGVNGGNCRVMAYNIFGNKSYAEAVVSWPDIFNGNDAVFIHGSLQHQIKDKD